MDSKTYIHDAKRTESQNFDEIAGRLSQRKMIRLLHSAMGVSTEAGELLDALKKHIYYGKKLDETNLQEELGDLFWYLAIMADELDVDFESLMHKNIEKLRARYGEKFTSQKAIHRDLELERQTLENS